MKYVRTLAVIMVLSPAMALLAQDASHVRPLTDADLPVVVKALKTYIAADIAAGGEELLKKTAAGLVSDSVAQAELDATVLAFRSGALDPLTWYRANSKHVLLPPGATYDRACSAARSSVIATMGVPASDQHDPIVDLVLAQAPPTKDAELRRALMAINGPYTGSARAINAGRALKTALAFYEKLGFEDKGRDPMFHSTTFVWPDPAADSLMVDVYPTIGLLYGISKECQHLPTGPVIAIGLNTESFAGKTTKEFDAANARSELVFENAGVERGTADPLIALVQAARMDAGQMEILETLRGFPEMKASTEIRIRNVAWYKRHAAQLDALLDRVTPR